MSRSNYINQLKSKLKRLPLEELTDALIYYEEYFDEAGVENETQAMEALGSPGKVAQAILADFSLKETEEMKPSIKKGVSSASTLVLAIFAAPIAVPLAVAAAAVVFALLVTIGALYLSFALIGISFFLIGVLALPLMLRILVVHFSTSLFILGTGLVFLGLGTLLLMATMNLTKLTVSGIISLSKRIRKGGTING